MAFKYQFFRITVDTGRPTFKAATEVTPTVPEEFRTTVEKTFATLTASVPEIERLVVVGPGGRHWAVVAVETTQSRPGSPRRLQWLFGPQSPRASG